MPPTAKRATLLTLPNAVSLSRLVFAAGFFFARTGPERLGLIGAASASDFLDGWLARRRGTASRWGALIDPFADRAFVFAAVVSFLFRGELTTGQYYTLLARDLMTAVGFLVARAIPWLRTVKFQARWSGKVVTVFQLAALAAVIVRPSAVSPLIYGVGAASAVSIVDYTFALWHARART